MEESAPLVVSRVISKQRKKKTFFIYIFILFILSFFIIKRYRDIEKVSFSRCVIVRINAIKVLNFLLLHERKSMRVKIHTQFLYFIPVEKDFFRSLPPPTLYNTHQLLRFQIENKRKFLFLKKFWVGKFSSKAFCI